MKILMIPLAAGKPWNGNTVLTEPLGGSEAAVAYLAQAFARKGNEVHVATHGEPCIDYCGVIYSHNAMQDLDKLIQEHEWDVVISSRWPEVLPFPWKTKKRAIWFHDLPSGAELRLRANLIVCLTQFHLNFFSEFVGSSHLVSIIGDGVDPSLLSIRATRDPNKLIWTSNPDRGLHLAARIFQEIRKRWPDMQLHVYGRASVYGWGAEAEGPFLPQKAFSENVFIHDPLPRSSLLREIASAWAFFYPTYWPETFCMATLEAQAVGTPVICPPYGALSETVKGGIVSYDFLNSVSQLRNKRRWNKLSVAGIEWAQQNTWDDVADKWLEAIDASPTTA